MFSCGAICTLSFCVLAHWYHKETYLTGVVLFFTHMIINTAPLFLCGGFIIYPVSMNAHGKRERSDFN